MYENVFEWKKVFCFEYLRSKDIEKRNCMR